MVKKLGIILIISGFLIPLILLMFFGDNWVPSREAGIIYSILNSELVFREEEDDEEEPRKIKMPDFGEEDNSKEDNSKNGDEGIKMPDWGEEDKPKISIPFRYVVGSGLISIFLGGFILIKEMG